jgi:excisionase family DNA binding protein
VSLQRPSVRGANGPLNSRQSLLSPLDVALMTGLTRETVYRALDEGRLKGYKVGGGSRPRWRIRVEDAEAWLNAG